VQLSTLAASPGWKLAAPLDQPLTIGSIGTNGIALAVIRLVRDPQGTGPAPLATVTGGGTLAGAAGGTDNFSISP
jgi:hypothetical protein